MLPSIGSHVQQFGKSGRIALLLVACLVSLGAFADRAEATGPAPVSRIIVALDATPDFLLELAPMLRQWRDAQLLVASEGNRASVTEYVERYPEAEVWVLQLGLWDLKVTNRSQRLFEGDADDLLQKLRAECWPRPELAVLADTSDRQQATLGAVLAAAHRAPLYLLDRKKASFALPLLPAVAHIMCVGRAEQWPAKRIMPGAQWSYVHDPDEILDAYAKSLNLECTEHLVVINPAGKELVDCSSLAVPYALRHHAAIWLAGNAAEADKRLAGILDKKFPHVKYVTILGDESCLSPTQVPDPAAPRLRLRATARYREQKPAPVQRVPSRMPTRSLPRALHPPHSRPPRLPTARKGSRRNSSAESASVNRASIAWAELPGPPWMRLVCWPPMDSRAKRFRQPRPPPVG